ncbi:hypothetical protein ACUXZZ_29375 [Streptomyces graminifolii]|uniref:hypothetical protein n=1 Tax=Streptomyces graminifolii TaxID=1266771 RepID=UPI004058B9CA
MTVKEAERRNAGGYGVGIELDRVLARLEKSGERENVVLGDEVVLAVLGALAIVDPKRVGGCVGPVGVPRKVDLRE